MLTGDQRIINSLHFWSHIFLMVFLSKQMYKPTVKMVKKKLGITGYWQTNLVKVILIGYKSIYNYN